MNTKRDLHEFNGFNEWIHSKLCGIFVLTSRLSGAYCTCREVRD